MVVDRLSYLIYGIMSSLYHMYQDMIGIQLNIDFNNDVLLGLFIVFYVIALVFIVKLIIGIVRWFYRI